MEGLSTQMRCGGAPPKCRRVAGFFRGPSPKMSSFLTRVNVVIFSESAGSPAGPSRQNVPGGAPLRRQGQQGPVLRLAAG